MAAVRSAQAAQSSQLLAQLTGTSSQHPAKAKDKGGNATHSSGGSSLEQKMQLLVQM
jgi:hypothetical protein